MQINLPNPDSEFQNFIFAGTSLPQMWTEIDKIHHLLGF